MASRKQELKDKGLVEIRLTVKQDHEQLIRLFAEKLTSGTITPGQTIKIE